MPGKGVTKNRGPILVSTDTRELKSDVKLGLIAGYFENKLLPCSPILSSLSMVVNRSHAHSHLTTVARASDSQIMSSFVCTGEYLEIMRINMPSVIQRLLPLEEERFCFNNLSVGSGVGEVDRKRC